MLGGGSRWLRLCRSRRSPGMWFHMWHGVIFPYASPPLTFSLRIFSGLWLLLAWYVPPPLGGWRVLSVLRVPVHVCVGASICVCECVKKLVMWVREGTWDRGNCFPLLHYGDCADGYLRVPITSDMIWNGSMEWAQTRSLGGGEGTWSCQWVGLLKKTDSFCSFVTEKKL